MVCGLAMAPSLPMAMVFIGLYGFLISFWYGPAYATVQGLLSNRMRATYLAGLAPHAQGPVVIESTAAPDRLDRGTDI